jgi:hypothetical protein
MSAGALSRWILWNKTSLRASIADYKKKVQIEMNLRQIGTFWFTVNKCQSDAK